MTSLRPLGLWPRQPCCSRCFYQEGPHVCLEQTPCRSLVGPICAYVGILFLEYSAGQHERLYDLYNGLDGRQLPRLDCLGLCLDDRSSPHAWEKCLDLASPLHPGTPPGVNAVRFISPAPHTVVIDRLGQRW